LSYLLIAFIVVVVLSPLAWLKSSPAQARMTAFRRRAGELGLKVQLTPSPEAEESEKRPDSVRYLRPLPPEAIAEANGGWTLLRNQRRGWPSPWQGWQWLRREAPESHHGAIARLLESLPAEVYALRLDQQGIAAYLAEKGEVQVVEALALALKTYPVAGFKPGAVVESP
jgi:hypothetical protein